MATALVDFFNEKPVPFDRLVLPEDYRPSEDEDFMCDRHRAYFLKKLREWKEAIIEESRHTMAQLQVDSLREPDIADRASSETDRSHIDRYHGVREAHFGSRPPALLHVESGFD